MTEQPTNRRLLIVDDNRAIHGDFARILGPLSPERRELEAAETRLFGDTRHVEALCEFELAHAMQGEEACTLVEQALAAERPFAMAFVDIRMPPGCDGLETAA